MVKSKITEVIVSRLQSMKYLKEETNPIGHSSSIGVVREKRLTDFLRSYLPNDIGVETGFVCDGIGNISPQIDIIITDLDSIPMLDFDGDMKLIPVEKVICCIEVKSTLTKNGLDQIIKQEQSINSMARCFKPRDEEGAALPPVVFSAFSLDCNLSIQAIKDFLSFNQWIRQVTVVGDSAHRNKHWGGFDIEHASGDSEYIETRRSLAWLLHMISDVKRQRLKAFPIHTRAASWEAYLGSDTLIPV